MTAYFWKSLSDKEVKFGHKEVDDIKYEKIDTDDDSKEGKDTAIRV